MLLYDSLNIIISGVHQSLGTTYNVHLILGLIGKLEVDFLLVFIELFSLGVTSNALRAKIDRKSAISLQLGHFNFRYKGSPHTNHFCTVS